MKQPFCRLPCVRKGLARAGAIGQHRRELRPYVPNGLGWDEAPCNCGYGAIKQAVKRMRWNNGLKEELVKK